MPDQDPTNPAGALEREGAEFPLLDGIHGPADLKALERAELPALCAEVRQFLLDSVQETGGHLGSNLGVVEIATALHYVFDFARDRIVWDVSHQAYPHKLFTGRRAGFANLRRTDGLCGFTHPDESPAYDMFHLGHAGTSISLGLGLAMGLSQSGERPHVVSVIGDASLGAGVAFEGLNNAGASGERLLVVLNDNEWSISKSVGALARYLSRIRSNRLVQRAQEEIHGLLGAIPRIGPKVESTLDQIREVLRHTIVQGHVFEELGVTYVGPLDGHDVEGLIEQIERVSELEGCVLLHVLTEKGKGHPNAPTHPERVHAAKPAAPKAPVKSASKSGRSTESPKIAPREGDSAIAAPQGPAFTTSFAQSLEDLAARDLRLHVITAGMPSGTGLVAFAERFPTRFHDVGITEQHAVAQAAGMAKAGLRPVCAIYSTFLQRAYDQVFQEVALQDLPVLFCLDRAGPVGQDGPTHNGVFDIAYLRTLPNFVLAAPRDATDMRRMLELGLTLDHPMALRYPRGNTPGRETLAEPERQAMEPGRAEVLREGDEIVIWAYGCMVETALRVSDQLAADGVAVGVVDARFAKPLDEDLLGRQLRSARHVVTLEDHQRAGGFGSAVLEAASRLAPLQGGRTARVRVLAIPDRYLEHRTTREEQLAAVGLDPGGVARTLRQLLAPSTV